MKNLNSPETNDALNLDQAELPKVTVTDNTDKFISNLNNEFLSVFDIEMRNNTLFHHGYQISIWLPDNPNKLKTRWRAPALVKCKKIKLRRVKYKKVEFKKDSCEILMSNDLQDFHRPLMGEHLKQE